MSDVGALEQSVKDALADRPAEVRDRATADLALTYARQIDTGGDLSKLGPALLGALEALHMSPRARTGKAVNHDQPGASPLDELRSRRARKSSAEVVDAATS